MNKQSITGLVKKLHNELPQLGSVAICESIWFARETGWKDHYNSSIRISVFAKNNNLLDGVNLPIDSTRQEITDAVLKIYNKAYPLELVE